MVPCGWPTDESGAVDCSDCAERGKERQNEMVNSKAALAKRFRMAGAKALAKCPISNSHCGSGADLPAFCWDHRPGCGGALNKVYIVRCIRLEPPARNLRACE